MIICNNFNFLEKIEIIRFITSIIDKYYKMTKMTVEQYRLNFVDYTDSTPNVPRVISNGTLHKTVYYPLGNIYYNVLNIIVIYNINGHS